MRPPPSVTGKVSQENHFSFSIVMNDGSARNNNQYVFIVCYIV